MHSVMTSATADAGLGALLPIGFGLIFAMITPLIAIRMYRRKRDEWRHIGWITALYIIGGEGIATGLMYGGAHNFLDGKNYILSAFSTYFLIVGVISVIATAFLAVLIGSNSESRRGGTPDR